MGALFSAEGHTRLVRLEGEKQPKVKPNVMVTVCVPTGGIYSPFSEERVCL